MWGHFNVIIMKVVAATVPVTLSSCRYLGDPGLESCVQYSKTMNSLRRPTSRSSQASTSLVMVSHKISNSKFTPSARRHKPESIVLFLRKRERLCNLVFFSFLEGCRRDKDGYYWITGRIDDMLNVSGTVVWGDSSSLRNKGYQITFYTAIASFWNPLLVLICFLGHLMSTAEVEAALTEHPAVAEAAVVSRPHKVKGECLYCFVTLKNSHEFNHTLVDEIKRHGEWQSEGGAGVKCNNSTLSNRMIYKTKSMYFIVQS